MKKLLITLSFLFAFGLFTIHAQCCNHPKQGCDQNGSCQQAKNNGDIKAYYFHATHRCATCMAIEDVTKEALNDYFGNKVAFSSINSEKDSNNPLIQKYKVSGQTLLFIKGDKVVNLTNYAFMNARSNPDKLKAKVKETVNSLN